MSKFWAPPILRNSDQDHNEHRHVTWLELFYDLAFVVAIAVVGHDLATNISAAGLITFTAFFVPIWWAWLSDAFYNNRFDPEDHGHQLLTIIQMFAILGIAIYAHIGLAEGYVGFAIFYALLRGINSFLSHRIGYYNKQTRSISFFTAKTVGLAAIVWLVSIFTPPPLRYILMTLAILIDVLAPILIASRQNAVPVNAAHITQRFGFFIIIVLGEVLTAVVRSVNNIGPSLRQLSLAGLSIALAFCLWWIYFENDYGPKIIKQIFTPTGRALRRTMAAGYVWTYAHLPLSMGIMAVAVGIEWVITQGPNLAVSPERITLLTFGTIAALLSIGTMQIAAMRRPENNIGLEHFKLTLPFISTILILLITYVSRSMTPLTLLASLVGICFLQVILQEVIEHKLETAA